LFGALPTATGEAAQLPAVAIPGRTNDYLAKAPSGEATFLLRGAGSPAVKPPLRLRHIEVDYGSQCRIQEGAAPPVEGEFIAIRSVDVGASGLELFVRTVEALVATLPTKPLPAETESLIAAIVELFRKLAQPARRSIKGLWAELYVIDRSAAPERMVAAWHAESDEKFDFLTPNGYVEVKATEQAVRVHDFALAQLRGPRSADGLVASLRLRRATGGVGILGLARRLTALLANEAARAKVWANVVDAMGRDFTEANDLAFDERFAEANAIVVAAQDVPCIAVPLPSGVIDARVTVDFSAIPPVACRGLAELDKTFV
jgi:hypothetical protein